MYVFFCCGLLREQADRGKQGPRGASELGRYTEDEAFMASGPGIDEANTTSAGIIQSGTGGGHELRWLQDPQIMEGDLRERERIPWKL